MSFNLAASTAVAVAHAQQAQDEPSESHCSAVLAPDPEAAIARVDDSSAVLRASAPQHTLDRLSPQFCSVVFRSRSAGLMCASMAAQLRLPRAQRDVLSALRFSGLCEERGRAIGWARAGLSCFCCTLRSQAKFVEYI